MNRAKQFAVTMARFKELYADRSDYEVIVVEDAKNTQDEHLHQGLLDVIAAYPEQRIRHIAYDVHPCYNPAGMFNLGRRTASGTHIVLTNPEITHESDVLAGFDKHFEEFPNQYVVCTCKSHEAIAPWYVHVEHRPEPLHFCSCMSMPVYDSVGGFDEHFIAGIACEDTDFVRQILFLGIRITIAPELIVFHQAHDRSYQLNRNEWMRLRTINGQILAANSAARGQRHER